MYPPLNPAVIRNPNQSQFKWTRILRDKYQIIREEVLQFQSPYSADLQVGELIPSQRSLNVNGGWKVIMLRCYGLQNKMVSSMFPRTMDLIRQAEEFVSIPHVGISILEPGKSIPPHRGYHHGIMKYHLTLSVPPHSPDDLHMKVWPDAIERGYEVVLWSNGSDVIFDDYNEHSVVNRINGTRIVMLVDFVRTDLSFPMSIFNKLMLSLAIRRSDMCVHALQRQDELIQEKVRDRRREDDVIL